MKQRLDPLPESDANASFRALAKALASLERVDEVAAFLQDLCTPAELEAMADRWRVVPLLLQGPPYREIRERTQVSVTHVGRVARTLEHGAGGYAAAVRRLYPRLAAGYRRNRTLSPTAVPPAPVPPARAGPLKGPHDESYGRPRGARPLAHRHPEIRTPERPGAGAARLVRAVVARKPRQAVLLRRDPAGRPAARSRRRHPRPA